MGHCHVASRRPNLVLRLQNFGHYCQVITWAHLRLEVSQSESSIFFVNHEWTRVRYLDVYKYDEDARGRFVDECKLFGPACRTVKSNLKVISGQRFILNCWIQIGWWRMRRSLCPLFQLQGTHHPFTYFLATSCQHLFISVTSPEC